MLGVRPNSPPHSTSVSSSNPRCFKSASNPAIAGPDANPDKDSSVNLLEYADQRIHDEVRLEFHITCQHSGFSLSEMRNYYQLAAQKESDLFLIENNIVTTAPEPEPAEEVAA